LKEAFREAALRSGVGVLRQTIGKLRPARASALGAAIGRLYARSGGARSDVARRNLELAFPEWSEAGRREVLVESFANLGRGIAELCVLQGPHRDALLARVRVEGFEFLEAAAARSELGGGVIVLTAHFGNWELCGAALAQQGVPISVIHREFDSPFLEGVMTGLRREGGLETLARGRAGFGLLRALKNGRVVAMLCDQNARPADGLFAPLFGTEACTRHAPVALAMARGVPILPVFFYREGDGSRHLVRAEPALELEPAGDDPGGALARNVALMNVAIETAIRRAPDHWMWTHRRFRTRPPGERPLYPARRRGWRRPLANLLACVALFSLLVGCDSRAREVKARLTPEGAARFEQGRRVASPCWSCHDFYNEQNNVGPYLVGLMERPIASARGFSYSPALARLRGQWTEKSLRSFLANPQAFAPGTSMAASGVQGEALDALVFYTTEITRTGHGP